MFSMQPAANIVVNMHHFYAPNEFLSEENQEKMGYIYTEYDLNQGSSLSQTNYKKIIDIDK
jgi:hypothetical protein